ncbi:hypothetical protein JOB18_023776 [Solea senegalensis]|uniref:Uncharacterized protein n=1 Tax=Solea senegalensis TaxID=28829 RepID=A0AAV6QUM1_SOLSE|nr:hypothetical protein JOB18_023776 [Solea senegalensis]
MPNKLQQQQSQNGNNGVECPLLCPVHHLPVTALFSRSWTNQNVEYGEAEEDAEEVDNPPEDSNQLYEDQVEGVHVTVTHRWCRCRSGGTPSLEAQVEDEEAEREEEEDESDGKQVHFQGGEAHQ